MNDQGIRAIIVDDEQPSRVAMSNYLQEYCPNIRVIAECNSANSAYQSIIDTSPELVFLDVEMPKGNGFDLLKMFQTIDFKVIFITAFSDYAIEAFRFSAIDYLLKPVKINELVEAVKKVEHELELQHSLLNIQTLLENIKTQTEGSKKLVISDSKGFSVINTDDIIYCEADGYCTRFHVTGDASKTSTHNLKYYNEFLQVNQFMRVHNSYIINLKHVKGYTHMEEILLSENKKCPLSNSFKKSFLSLFRQYK